MGRWASQTKRRRKGTGNQSRDDLVHPTTQIKDQGADAQEEVLDTTNQDENQHSQLGLDDQDTYAAVRAIDSVPGCSQRNTGPYGHSLESLLSLQANHQVESLQGQDRIVLHVGSASDHQSIVGPAGHSRVSGSIATVPMKRRGKRQENKPKIRRGKGAFVRLKMLTRLGILPIASSIDDFWILQMKTFIDGSDERRRTNGEELDPFLELRLHPHMKLPEYLKDVSDCDQMAGYEAVHQVRTSIMEIARKHMLVVAIGLLGPVEIHEHAFTNFDCLENFYRFTHRHMLFKSQTALRNMFGDELAEQMFRKFDFNQRARLCIDLMAILFAGMIAAFKLAWTSKPNSAYALFGKKLICSDLDDLVFKKMGGPAWNREWVKVLLFSVPPSFSMCSAVPSNTNVGSDRANVSSTNAQQDACSSDSSDDSSPLEELFRIGANFEILCMIQLVTVMSMEKLKIEQYRGTTMGPAGHMISSEHESQIPIMVPFAFQGSQPRYRDEHAPDGESIRYCFKNAPYPWDKVIKWYGILRSASGITGESSPSVSRYSQMFHKISYERKTLDGYLRDEHKWNKIGSDELRTRSGDKLDALADMIVEAGAKLASAKGDKANLDQNSIVPQASDDDTKLDLSD